jgi:Uma2 family endonuclease
MATDLIEKAEPFELHPGDRMTRAEFHRVYEQMPERYRAELIGGIVYLPSPLKRRHGTIHPFVNAVIAAYEGSTPGVECGDNTTILLGEEGEPQPDVYLRILPEYGGQSATTDDDYVLGPPELIVEIAHSSRSIELHAKKNDYKVYGVQEYLVLCIRESVLRWFDLAAGTERTIENDGVVRAASFPGLWIHAEALLGRNYAELIGTLEMGLATTEHAKFVQRLAAVRGNV